MSARAQPAAPASIEPTTTVATGDRGGTFFGAQPDPSKTRHYYIAAESALWDFAPSGKDEVCGLPLPPPLLAERKVTKLRYVQYTDATFRTRALPSPTLGILGPVLRGVVGEFLAVTFLNRTTQPLSLHPHGVHYDKDSEGAYYQPAPGRGAAVAPGATFTYVWQLDESSGPLPSDPSSKAWLYHSHVSGDTETNLGLVGAIVVTDPKRARPDGTPADVDREFATLFMIFDESGLDEAAIEAAEYGNAPGLVSAPPTWPQVQQAIELGSRYAINGYVFGNLPGLEAHVGERVRWYLFALGSERDFHTAHWHGLRVVAEGRRTDVVELLPASMKVADLVADNPGTWLFHCHVAEHMKEGMFARLVVRPRAAAGAERATGAFLGWPTAAASLRLDRAEVEPDAHGGRELVLAGAATVFEGYSVFNQLVRVRLGEKSLEFHPDAHGTAVTPEGTFRVKNANEFGVVAGGLLEFSLVLPAPAASAAPVPFTLALGRTEHRADLRLTAK